MLRLLSAGPHQHQGYVILGQVFGISFLDLCQQGSDEFLRFHVAQQTHDPKQPALAQHFAVGIARLDEGIGVAQEAIAGLQFDVELLVLCESQQPQGDVLRFGLLARSAVSTARRILSQKIPLSRGRPV